MQNKKKRKPEPSADSTLSRAAQRIGKELDLPPEILPGFSSLEMLGNREAVVAGVKGVLDYSDCKIVLNMGSLIESFAGVDLRIRSYAGEQVILSGHIMTVEFSQC